MPQAPGDKIGTYEILAPLGAGGMGEVYRARDSQLKREVALKVLPADFANDPERLARFQREAEILASLNHPGIAAIYGLAGNALAMEFVDGETLPCPLPLDTAIAYARQIVEALEYAHDRGVIHRDLKPANIKVTHEGVVKLLDFGLAKALDERAASPQSTQNSPTLTMGATAAGLILGTAAYMSPEQAVGKNADRRSDIFSFGAVFYEMLTGKQAFAGETVGEILANVVKDPLDWSALPAATPAHVRKLLERALHKDRRQRLQAIGEARILLDQPVEPEPAPPPVATRASWLWPALAAVAVVLAAAVSFVHFRETPPEPPRIEATLLPPENSSFDFSNPSDSPALSPDGRRIVFAARTAGKLQLWLRSLDSQEARVLPGTENGSAPFWSPDGRSIGFIAQAKLKRIDLAGGPPTVLADAPYGQGGSWSPDGIIIFAPVRGGKPLMKVPAAGGTATPATATGRPLSPRFLPDGRHFLIADIHQGVNGIFAGSLDSDQLKPILSVDSKVAYAAGHLLFTRESTLMAQPFDTKRLAVTGEARPIAHDVRVGRFSVAGDTLVYQAAAGRRSAQLTWFDRTGKVLDTVGKPADFDSVHFSPDRKSLAAVLGNSSADVWIYDLARGLPTRFTAGTEPSRNPVWSPDGHTIAFDAGRRGWQIFRKSADGTGNVEFLAGNQKVNYVPSSWSPDGKVILFHQDEHLTGNRDVWVLPFAPDSAGQRVSYPFLQSPFNQGYAVFSPDGRWVAYESDESQRTEIFVTPFPGPGPRRQISAEGGQTARWRADGKEIFYVSPAGNLMSAELNIAAGKIDVKQIHSLPISVPFLSNMDSVHAGYDVSADGQRVLVAAPLKQEAPVPLTLIYNWLR